MGKLWEAVDPHNHPGPNDLSPSNVLGQDDVPPWIKQFYNIIMSSPKQIKYSSEINRDSSDFDLNFLPSTKLKIYDEESDKYWESSVDISIDI